MASWQVIAIAFVLDAVLGDPKWRVHPVALMGEAAVRLEWFARRLIATWAGRRTVGVTDGCFSGCFIRSSVGALSEHEPQEPSGEFDVRNSSRRLCRVHAFELLGGAAVSAVLIFGSWGIAEIAIRAARTFLGSIVAIIAAGVIMYFTLTTKSLTGHVMAVYQALSRDDLAGARQAVSLIVGRDTESLGPTEVSRAAVESAAEGLCDGIVAPLFFGLLGGAPLAIAYRAINTLDSMMGHRNEEYEYFGKVVAKLDDIANYVPARLAALAISLAGAVAGVPIGAGFSRIRRVRQALLAALADGSKHPSPNSGYPEAAMAGLLGVRLGGLNYYGGKPSFRPYLGKAGNPLDRDTVLASVKVVWVAAWISAAVIVGTGCLWSHFATGLL